jgi:hypothetical protein
MMHTRLYAGRLAVLAIGVACAPLGAQQPTAPAAQPAAAAARPSDVASPEAVVTALYDLISGPAAQPRDWGRFRSLFLESGNLAFVMATPAGERRLLNLSVEDFVRLAGPSYQTGTGFWEREIGHRVDRFGSVAHVFTAYETRRTAPDGPVSERGINSVQMIRHQDRWWISNLVFDSESPTNPIPPEYLNTPRE